MDADYTEEHRRLRREFREYLGRLMTPQLKAATRDRESGTAYRDTLRRMGADGWLTPGWPPQGNATSAA